MASSRGLAPALAALVPPERTLLLGHATKFSGGNAALLKTLPRLVRWLRGVDADWINAHYLTSHGTLAWLARRPACARSWRRRRGARTSSSRRVTARVLRWLTSRVLRDATVCTSDSAHMAERMRALGAREVMTFPFGLDALPAGARRQGAAPVLRQPRPRGHLRPATRADAVRRRRRGVARRAPGRGQQRRAARGARARRPRTWGWPIASSSSAAWTPPRSPRSMPAPAGTSACRAATRCRSRCWRRWATAASRCCRTCPPTASWCATAPTG